MKLYQLLIGWILLVFIIALVMPQFFIQSKQCIRLETGPEGTLQNNSFCDDQGCRKPTVSYTFIECDDAKKSN